MKRYAYILLLAGALCAACSDFLTETPRHSMVRENSVTDYTSAQNIVNGIYGVHEWNCDDLGGQLYGALHCMAGLWTYNPVFYNMGYTETGDESLIRNIWRELYACVNAANSALAGVSALADSKFPSAEAKQSLLAEARCFRGYCNLELLWLFGHWFDGPESAYGILYRDKSADLNNLNGPRSTVGESYQLILDDLTFAEQHLGNYVGAYRMSKQFAEALHAKLLLVRGWDGDYAEALTLVNTLLTQAPAAFQMETNLAKLYTDGWNSKELLFSRYLGDRAEYGRAEKLYSTVLYTNEQFTDTPWAWLQADERYPIYFGDARSPEQWDARHKDNVLVKLYHRGVIEGLNDMYATYVFRYAELYLMKAELLARTNPADLAGALAPLNEMRSRYTNPVMAPLPAPATHQELMDAIYKEYVVTLFMENESPWFASIRFEHGGKPWLYTLKPEVNFSTDQYCWPIPSEELNPHSNQIEQNPSLK